jgi:signal peptidase I
MPAVLRDRLARKHPIFQDSGRSAYLLKHRTPLNTLHVAGRTRSVTITIPTSFTKLLGAAQIAAAVALCGLILTLLAGIAPSMFGYESFVVLSGSMEPALQVGDLAVVAPIRTESLMVGDIITYRQVRRPDILVTHRIVNIGLDEQGRLKFQTRGDANNTSDQVLIDSKSVLGRVAYSIPRLGYLVDFSKRGEGKVLLIGLPGLMLVLDTFRGRKRRTSADVVPVQTESGALVAQGRIAQQNGSVHAAITLLDRAIAADPHNEDAWLLKAECLEESDSTESVACLRSGLTVNPASSKLREALERATLAQAATS